MRVNDVEALALDELTQRRRDVVLVHRQAHEPHAGTRHCVQRVLERLGVSSKTQVTSWPRSRSPRAKSTICTAPPEMISE